MGFLASRKGSNMSEALRNALTTMLYHTGTPTSQFMLVIATNRPDDLDAAALDRIDESVEFGLPAFDARKSMVNLYFDKYIAKPLKLKLADLEASAEIQSKPKRNRCSFRAIEKSLSNLPPHELVNADDLHEVARQIAGFSGREISKLFTALQTHILYSNGAHLDKLNYLQKDLIYDVVQQKVLEHSRTHEFQSVGYEYVHDEPALEQHLNLNLAEPCPQITKAPRIEIHTGGHDGFVGPKISPKGPISASLGFVPNSTAA